MAIRTKENAQKGGGVSIAYQNKDIISKIFGEAMLEKSLNVYGINLPKVKRVLPTNLPGIELKEQRVDNIFELEDGSYAIIDYESCYDSKNKIKYLGYILRLIRRFCAEGKKLSEIKLHIIVIYTADVERKNTKSELDVGAVKMYVDEAFLSEINGDYEFALIEKKILRKENLSEEDIMKLMIIALSYSGKKEKQKAVNKSIKLARKIEDEQTRNYILAGIICYSDKIIDPELEKKIWRELTMTKIGRRILEEVEKKDKIIAKKDKKIAKMKKENEKITKRFIQICKSNNESLEVIVDSVKELLNVNEEKARELVEQYW